MENVKDFFESAGRGDYEARYQKMSEINRASSAAIRKMATGRVVSVGGLWPGETPDTVPKDTTVIDISPQMLDLWNEFPVEGIVADALHLPFDDRSIGMLVYPMVLHHLCDGTVTGARASVKQAFTEAARVLSREGKLVIVDYCVSLPVYAAECTMAPVIRRLLGVKGIPLVIMHSAGFYRSSLQDAGFMQIEKINTGEMRHPLALIQPVIGLPWLVVPKFVYPVNPLFMVARFGQSTSEL